VPGMNEDAARALGRIRDAPGERLCAPCLATALVVERRVALQAFREMVVAGAVLCMLDTCPVCHQEIMVARFRGRYRPFH
jgi:hypothetical protein